MDSIRTPLSRAVAAVSRRAVLRASTAGLALALFSQRGRSAVAQGDDLTHIYVSVHAPGGAHYDGAANVLLRHDGTQIALQRAPNSVLYEAMLQPGIYTLEVSAEGLVAPARPVEVGTENRTASAYLGRDDWPFFRLGENIIPFEPREDLVAIVFEVQKPELAEVAGLVQILRDRFPLVPFAISGKTPLPFAAANGSIWLFRLTDLAARDRVMAEIPGVLQRPVRVGMPIDVTPGQVKVLDNYYVVRFQDRIPATRIAEIVPASGATIVRDFIQSPQARLIVFPAIADYRAHLAVIESWFGQGVLVYGEPDLLAEISDASLPPDFPHDPYYPSQINLQRQGVKLAWELLSEEDPDLTLGSPEAYVATVDTGVGINHTDINGALTDGTKQLIGYFDFPHMQECLASGAECIPADTHGMGVYGIIAATTNNERMISGIAPNTHQIAILRPDLRSVLYDDMLLWTAGFDTGNRSRGFAWDADGVTQIPLNWPEEPIDRGADIINCSHVVNYMPKPGIMEETFAFLANEGRNGLGTILVYSSGNNEDCMTGIHPWATDPRTLAISSSSAPEGEGVETREYLSNWGPELDLCANGAGVWSLFAVDGPPQRFGQTSAAAPTVAAAVALMLSANPNLTWSQVRQILIDNAEQIDPGAAAPGDWGEGDLGTLFSQWYGYGRLRVDLAVQAALDSIPDDPVIE